MLQGALKDAALLIIRAEDWFWKYLGAQPTSPFLFAQTFELVCCNMFCCHYLHLIGSTSNDFNFFWPWCMVFNDTISPKIHNYLDITSLKSIGPDYWWPMSCSLWKTHSCPSFGHSASKWFGEGTHFLSLAGVCLSPPPCQGPLQILWPSCSSRCRKWRQCSWRWLSCRVPCL